MLYRNLETEYSYSVSSEIFVLSGKTKVFDVYWKFVEGNDEELIVSILLKKMQRLRAPIEMFDIYGIVSSSDKKFRLRNIIFEDKNKSSNDHRKVNRGRNIDSYSLQDLINIALILFTKQINYNYILSIMEDYYLDDNNIMILLEKKNIIFDGYILNKKYISSLLIGKRYDFRLAVWLMAIKKQELKGCIFSALIDNDMYIII